MSIRRARSSTRMDDSAVFAVRAKYADDLEELVQCPVCFERPSGSVPTCRQGHHLCGRCRDSLLACPVCRSDFGDARNFVVEELSSKLADILSSLLEPNPIPVAPASKATRSASTQTDAPPTQTDESVLIVEEHLMMGCRIGFCQARLPAECVYFHVRDYHRANMLAVEATSSGGDSDDDSFASSVGCSFSHSWLLAYELDKLLDYAVYADELGLFFFGVHVDREGTLLMELRIADSYRDEELEYEIGLRVPNKRKSVLYTGKVQTCLASARKFTDPHKCGKDFFEYFFEGDRKTLNKQRTLPFVIKLDVYPIERHSRGPVRQ